MKQLVHEGDGTVDRSLDAAKVQERLATAMGAKVGNPARRVGAHYSVVEYQSSHVSGGAIAGNEI